jgi:hypothetical protein
MVVLLSSSIANEGSEIAVEASWSGRGGLVEAWWYGRFEGGRRSKGSATVFMT